MAERVRRLKMDDPLNLMRVMPTQGGQPAFQHAFIFNHELHEYTKINDKRMPTRNHGEWN